MLKEIKKAFTLMKTNYLVGASMIYILCSFLIKGISFLTTPVFTRIMDTSDYGIVSAVSTWVTFIAIVICCQVSGTVSTARVHKEKADFEAYMGNITVLGLISAVVVGGLLILFREPIGGLMGIQPRLVIHAVLQAYGSALAALYTAYLIQTKQPKANMRFALTNTLVAVGGGLLFVSMLDSDKYMGRIWAFTIAYGGVMLFVLHKFLPRAVRDIGKLKADWKFALMLGIPLIFHLISNTILGQSDRLFILHMMGDSDAGIYTVAYSISIIGMIFADACNNAWSPWYLENTKAGNHEQIRKTARIYLLFISFCFAEVFLLSSEIFEIMAPEPYWKAKTTVFYIIAGVFFQFLYRFPQAYESYRKDMRWMAVCTTTVAVLNCILNGLMIPSYGIDGAAVATLISYIVLFLLHELVARRVLGGFNIPARIYILPVIICFAACAVSYVLLPYRAVRLTLAVIMGAAMLFLLYKKLLKNRK